MIVFFTLNDLENNHNHIGFKGEKPTFKIDKNTLPFAFVCVQINWDDLNLTKKRSSFAFACAMPASIRGFVLLVATILTRKCQNLG